MAKKKQAFGQKHRMGSGHVVPEGMSKADYAKLKRKWDDKLAKSGLIDIEQSDDEGYVSPVFSQQHGMSSNAASSHIMRRYTPEKERFYYLCGNFLTHFNWPTMTHDKYSNIPKASKWEHLKHMWSLYCDGYSTQEVFDKLPKKWGYKRWGVRDLIREMRQISATWNRHDPNGGSVEHDF